MNTIYIEYLHSLLWGYYVQESEIELITIDLNRLVEICLG